MPDLKVDSESTNPIRGLLCQIFNSISLVNPGGLFLFFLILQKVYPTILNRCLRHKIAFLSIADRVVGKPYIEINIDRDAIARYGIMIRKIQDVIEVAIGGKRITTTIEGSERYSVRVRYARELRDQNSQTKLNVLTQIKACWAEAEFFFHSPGKVYLKCFVLL